ncbi:hypothetical protein ABZ951_00635 [Streptomyces sp. NPDC046215]|uniref:Uncharacterized protein n=1 Tax=Streptomyces stramineus TaxID=173861 RepID=A0ABP3JK70_9ACTN
MNPVVAVPPVAGVLSELLVALEARPGESLSERDLVVLVRAAVSGQRVLEWQEAAGDARAAGRAGDLVAYEAGSSEAVWSSRSDVVQVFELLGWPGWEITCAELAARVRRVMVGRGWA